MRCFLGDGRNGKRYGLDRRSSCFRRCDGSSGTLIAGIPRNKRCGVVLAGICCRRESVDTRGDIVDVCDGRRHGRILRRARRGGHYFLEQGARFLNAGVDRRGLAGQPVRALFDVTGGKLFAFDEREDPRLDVLSGCLNCVFDIFQKSNDSSPL